MEKILKPNKFIHRLIGKYRLLFSFCPRCNSDAPGVYYCFVCKQVHIDSQKALAKNNRHYPINLASKALWWYTWVHPSFENMQKDHENYLQVD